MERSTVICGDFNLCFVERNDHPVIQSLLNLGFEQKVARATHIQGGTIDHVYFRKGQTDCNIEVHQYSPYYTALDHDALCIELTEPLACAELRYVLTKSINISLLLYKEFVKVYEL